jgi:hypothetical protein
MLFPVYMRMTWDDAWSANASANRTGANYARLSISDSAWGLIPTVRATHDDSSLLIAAHANERGQAGQ